MSISIAVCNSLWPDDDLVLVLSYIVATERNAVSDTKIAKFK